MQLFLRQPVAIAITFGARSIDMRKQITIIILSFFVVIIIIIVITIIIATNIFSIIIIVTFEVRSIEKGDMGEPSAQAFNLESNRGESSKSKMFETVLTEIENSSLQK